MGKEQHKEMKDAEIAKFVLAIVIAMALFMVVVATIDVFKTKMLEEKKVYDRCTYACQGPTKVFAPVIVMDQANCIRSCNQLYLTLHAR